MALLVHVVETGSMRAAARKLGLTPSAVSQQIRQLERETGVTLLRRSTRRLALTDAGQAFYEGCVAMLAAARGAHERLTELHDSARIDRQLMGRCGRQGDPGSVRQYMSLDDDVVRNGLGPDVAERYKAAGESRKGQIHRYESVFRRAQRAVEKKHFRDRMILLHHEKERKKMQREMGQDPYLDTPD